MAINAPIKCFNLEMLTKILQVIVKLKFKKLTTGENLIEPPISQVDKILASL
jgi:hypothetical protein